MKQYPWSWWVRIGVCAVVGWFAMNAHWMFGLPGEARVIGRIIGAACLVLIIWWAAHGPSHNGKG